MKAATGQPQFHGKVALITGGTAGIGAATVKRISELGANVLFTGRHVDNAERIIRDTEGNSGRVAFIPADLSVPEEVRKIIPLVVSTFGRLDFAFNNAGTKWRLHDGRHDRPCRGRRLPNEYGSVGG